VETISRLEWWKWKDFGQWLARLNRNVRILIQLLKGYRYDVPEMYWSRRGGGEEGFPCCTDSWLCSRMSTVFSTGGDRCRMEEWSKLQTGLVIWLNVTQVIIKLEWRGTDQPPTDSGPTSSNLFLKERKKNITVRRIPGSRLPKTGRGSCGWYSCGGITQLHRR
jgi:hypothetical protein